MSPLDSLETAKNMLEALMQREQPLAKQIPPSPGSRAERYIQLLSPDQRADGESETSNEESAEPDETRSNLLDRVATLEAEVATLRGALSKLAAAVGEPDPFMPTSPA